VRPVSAAATDLVPVGCPCSTLAIAVTDAVIDNPIVTSPFDKPQRHRKVERSDAVPIVSHRTAD
jgi:hypothetical protein